MFATPIFRINNTLLTGILYFVENNQYQVVGHLASGQVNCQPYVPSVFVHLEKYLGWIKNQTLSNEIMGIFICFIYF